MPLVPIAKVSRELCAMSTFDQRKEGFEKKFAHDADLKFKAESRRNHLAAAWAAEAARPISLVKLLKKAIKEEK